MIQKIEQGHEYLILMPALHDPGSDVATPVVEIFEKVGAKVRLIWHHGSGSPVVLDVTPPAPEREPLKVGDRVRVTATGGFAAEVHFGTLVAIDDKMALIDINGVESNVSLRSWNIERA